MKNEIEKELIESALDCLSHACTFLFETKSDNGKALAFMTDSLLRYATVIYHGDDPLHAACNFTGYEEEVYERKQKMI